MNTMTLEQMRDCLRAYNIDADEYHGKFFAKSMADVIDAHLREREAAEACPTCDGDGWVYAGSVPGDPGRTKRCPACEAAKAMDAEPRGTYACPVCGKEYPHYHPEDTSRINWHSDYRKVFEDVVSKNVRLYKDGVSIAATNYSHDSKLTVIGTAGHWFAYGADDARSFGRQDKGKTSSAWSEFASNGDGYAHAWMDSLWSLFKQTVVALKEREVVAPMLASAQVPDGWKLVPTEPTEEMVVAGDNSGFRAYTGTWVIIPDSCWKAMLAAAPKPEKE